MSMDIQLHVTLQDTDELKVAWRTGGREFPAYAVDRLMIEEYSKAARDALLVMAREAVKSADSSATTQSLRVVMRSGKKLYESLFINRQGALQNRIRTWLETRTAACAQSGTAVYLHIYCDRRLYVPWGLVFQDSDDVVDSNSGSIEDSHGLWALKYRLSATMVPLEPEPSWLPRPSGTPILTVRNATVYSNVLKALRQIAPAETAFVEAFLQSQPNIAANSSGEFFAVMAKERARVGILHFFCHADGSRLELDVQDCISVSDFKRATVASDPSEYPTRFVFLNGCATAGGSPVGAFMEATSRLGLCGLIGTETKVPAVFALRFGSALLHDLATSGDRVVDIIYRLRRQHWPLGLIYCLYGEPFFRIDAPAAPSLAAPPSFGGNFSGAAGGQEMTAESA